MRAPCPGPDAAGARTRLEEALKAALQDDDLRARLNELAIPLTSEDEGGRERQGRLLELEAGRRAAFIRETGMRAE